MNRITVKNLPEQKLSYVILQVIEDINRVIKFGYIIDMSVFVDSRRGLCSVCLGGAAVMGFVPDERVKRNYNELDELVTTGVNEGISEDEQKRLRHLAYTFDDIREGNIDGAINNWNHIAAVHPIWNHFSRTSDKITANLEKHIDEYGTTEFNNVIEGTQLDRLEGYLLALSKEFEKLGY